MREVLETDPKTGYWRKVRVYGGIYWRYRCHKCGLTAVTMREELYEKRICPRCNEGPGKT